MKLNLLKNFLNFLPQMFNRSTIVALAGNGLRLCAGGDFSTETELKNKCSTYYKCFIVVLMPHLHKTDVTCRFFLGSS